MACASATAAGSVVGGGVRPSSDAAPQATSARTANATTNASPIPARRDGFNAEARRRKGLGAGIDYLPTYEFLARIATTIAAAPTATPTAPTTIPIIPINAPAPLSDSSDAADAAICASRAIS